MQCIYLSCCPSYQCIECTYLLHCQSYQCMQCLPVTLSIVLVQAVCLPVTLSILPVHAHREGPIMSGGDQPQCPDLAHLPFGATLLDKHRGTTDTFFSAERGLQTRRHDPPRDNPETPLHHTPDRTAQVIYSRPSTTAAGRYIVTLFTNNSPLAYLVSEGALLMLAR